MTDYTLDVSCGLGFEDTVAAVREELGTAGFGVLTEIDLQATLKAKIGAEIDAQVILGACNPKFAHQAIQADPSVAALLPCNVVVRSLDETTTKVEAFDPAAMARLAGAEGAAGIEDVATEVRALLQGALARVAERGRNEAS